MLSASGYSWAGDEEARPSDRLRALEFLARDALPRLIEARFRDAPLTDEATLQAWEARLDEDPDLAEAVEELFRRLHDGGTSSYDLRMMSNRAGKARCRVAPR